VNVSDSLNRTALHYSAEQNNIDIAKLLVKNGADINKLDYTNRTALALANDWGSTKVSKFLIDNGASVVKSDIIELEGAVNKKSEIKVTYIANMGFMVSSSSKTVLIDALFDEGFGSYALPSKQIVEKINQLEKPFNSVDLMLVTHDDGDHFSTSMIAEYLTKNNKAKVVCSKKGFSKLKENKDIKVDSSRIVGITPELYNSIDTKVNGIEIKILRLRHSGRDGRTENLGFLFDLDGMKVLHVGDATGIVWKGAVVSGIEEYDAIGLKNMQIDVAILNRGSLWGIDAPGIEIIEKYIKPKHIILGHFSIGNKDGEDEVFQTIEKYKDNLPGITILNESMQNIIIKNN
jgi:L-ascorbate metabolism protein UlaG (beta-lactamase superfamily)